MSKIPEVFAIFEQKLAHVLSFTVVPLKSKDLKNALEEILTYFSGIVERASKAESRIAELEVAQRWIPVGERLPEEFTPVLTFSKDNDKPVTAILAAGFWWSNVDDAGFWSSDVDWALNVTHWMPLPSAPESEDE